MSGHAGQTRIAQQETRHIDWLMANFRYAGWNGGERGFDPYADYSDMPPLIDPHRHNETMPVTEAYLKAMKFIREAVNE